MGVWVCPIWLATGSLKDSHIWADHCRGKRCGDERWVRLFLASSQTQRPKVDIGRWVKHRLSANAVSLFVTFLGPVTFHSLGKNCVGNYWWAPLPTLLVSGTARRQRRSAPVGIGRQVRASGTIPSFRSLRDLHGTRCPFSAWTSEWAWQKCLIALAAAMAWKKRLSTPSTTASGFARSGITSGSGRLASNPNSSCCPTLVTSWTTFCLRFMVWSVWCVSRDPRCSENGDLDDAK